MKKWSKRNNINPDLIISMQNTTIRFDNDKIPQISYIMQAIPFITYSWSLFKKEERILWFYKYIYPFFMSRFLNKKHYVVTQSKWIKYAFAEKFNFSLEKIFSVRPFVKLDSTNKKVNLSQNYYNVFCPSSAFKYKNNMEIVNTLKYLKSNNKLQNNIKIYITINELDDEFLYNRIQQNGLTNYFIFLGRISYEQMLCYYNSVDLVIFPSYLETFGFYLKQLLMANQFYLLMKRML